MSENLPHFAVGQTGHVEKLNKLVDTVNAQSDQLEKLQKELDGKADKRSSKTATTEK